MKSTYRTMNILRRWLPPTLTSAFLTAAFVVTGIHPAQGQALPAKLLGSAVYVESGSESASGFMVCHAYTDKLCKVYLITNKHAIPQQGTKAAIRVRVTIEAFSTPEIKYLTVPVVGDDGLSFAKTRSRSSRAV